MYGLLLLLLLLLRMGPTRRLRMWFWVCLRLMATRRWREGRGAAATA